MYAKGLTSSPKCKQCNLNMNEDVEHVLLTSPTYKDSGDILNNKLANLGIQNINLKNLLGGAEADESIKKQIKQSGYDMQAKGTFRTHQGHKNSLSVCISYQ